MQKMRLKVMYCLGICMEKLNKTTKILSPCSLCPSLCSKAVPLNGNAALHQLLDFVWIVAVGFLEHGVAIFYEVLWLWVL